MRARHPARPSRRSSSLLHGQRRRRDPEAGRPGPAPGVADGATRFCPQPTAVTAASVAIRIVNGRDRFIQARRAVPASCRARATTAAGVSRRIESGESLHDASRDVGHHTSNDVEYEGQVALGRCVDELCPPASRCPDRWRPAVSSLRVTPGRPSAPVLSASASNTSCPACAGIDARSAHDKGRARRDLDAACGGLLSRRRNRGRSENKSAKAARPIFTGPPTTPR